MEITGVFKEMVYFGAVSVPSALALTLEQDRDQCSFSRQTFYALAK